MSIKTEKANILEESLVEYNEIQKFISENTEKTISNILEDKIDRSIRNILTEADDEDENESSIDDLNSEKTEDEASENEEGEDISQEGDKSESDDESLGINQDDEELDINDNEMDADDIENEDDVDLESFKTGDDEYDLTNSDTETLIKVFKKIGDDDKVVVKKLDDGKINLIDSENDAEYVIDLDADIESSDGDSTEFQTEDESNDDMMIEIELDDESDIIDEKTMTQSIGSNRRVGVMNQARKDYAPGKQTNRDGAKLITSEDIKKIQLKAENKIKIIETTYASKFNELLESIKQYKVLLENFRNKFKEQAVLNNNLAKYAKLVTENTTTKNEKVEILKRFSTEATTIESGDRLFESINEQLKKTNSSLANNIDKNLSVVTENKKVNESVIYESDDLTKMKSLINRMG